MTSTRTDSPAVPLPGLRHQLVGCEDAAVGVADDHVADLEAGFGGRRFPMTSSTRTRFGSPNANR